MCSIRLEKDLSHFYDCKKTVSLLCDKLWSIKSYYTISLAMKLNELEICVLLL